MNHEDPSLYTTGGAVIGALGIKIIEKIFRMKRQESAEAHDIRKEMRDEIKSLNLKIESVHSDLDHWKSKYYRLSEENAVLKVKCQTLDATILNLMAKFNGNSSHDRRSLDYGNTPE